MLTSTKTINQLTATCEKYHVRSPQNYIGRKSINKLGFHERCPVFLIYVQCLQILPFLLEGFVRLLKEPLWLWKRGMGSPNSTMVHGPSAFRVSWDTRHQVDTRYFFWSAELTLRGVTSHEPNTLNLKSLHASA